MHLIQPPNNMILEGKMLKAFSLDGGKNYEVHSDNSNGTLCERNALTKNIILLKISRKVKRWNDVSITLAKKYVRPI